MKLLIVEVNKAFRDFLRLWFAEQASGYIPDVWEAATLLDALRILGKEPIDAVLCGGKFPLGWGDGMGDPLDWKKSPVTLRRECATREVPFVLLCGNPFRKLLMARSAIEKVLSLTAAHCRSSAS